MTRPRPWRPTIRLRLTVLHAAALVLVGAFLVVVLNLYLAQVLNHQTGRTPTIEHLSVEQHDALTSELQQDRADTQNAMLAGSVVVLAAIALGAVGLGWLLAGRAMAPLQQITATARRVADQSLHERIALDGPDDEIKEVADTIDAMLERLDRSFDGQRRFVANAAHELRTPLTINRTLIEVALDRASAGEDVRQLGTSLLAVNERSEQLIDSLLLLAASENGLTERIPVDVADIAGQVVATSRDVAERAGVEVRSSLENATVAGDPVLLERLVQNLVENAIRYNRGQDGWLRLTTSLVDGTARVRVENSGPQVAAEDLASLFEPFRRVATTERIADPNDAGGAGLGLSIVRSIARAHGGEVQAEAPEEGGLRVEISIPVLAISSADATPPT